MRCSDSKFVEYTVLIKSISIYQCGCDVYRRRSKKNVSLLPNFNFFSWERESPLKISGKTKKRIFKIILMRKTLFKTCIKSYGNAKKVR